MTRRRVVQTTMFPDSPSEARRSGSGIATDSMRRASDELDRMIANDDFAPCTAIHLVALYLKLHVKVYGIEAIDCGPSDRTAAAGRAAVMIRENFDGSGEAAVEFLRWTWTREKDRENFRRANRRSGNRITWRLQFSSSLLIDYRLDLARKKSSGTG
jgi:hypothetical protein